MHKPIMMNHFFNSSFLWCLLISGQMWIKYEKGLKIIKKRWSSLQILAGTQLQGYSRDNFHFFYFKFQKLTSCWKTAVGSFIIHFNTNIKSISWKLSLLLWCSSSSQLSIQPLNEVPPSLNRVDSLPHEQIQMNLFNFDFIQRQLKQTRAPTVPNDAWKLWALFQSESVPHLRLWDVVSQLQCFYFHSHCAEIFRRQHDWVMSSQPPWPSHFLTSPCFFFLFFFLE